MEDKKVMEFINKNHEKAYNNFLINQKKKERKEKILGVMYSILLVAIIVLFIIIIRNDTKEAIKHCMSNGKDYETCLVEVQ